MTTALQCAVQRALSAWDTTTLKTNGDGMLSEAMEALRAEFGAALAAQPAAGKLAATNACGSGAGCLYKDALIEHLRERIIALEAPQPAPAEGDAAPYELDDVDRQLVALVKKGVTYEDSGAPIKDVMDGDDLVEACRLLLNVLGEEPEDTRSVRKPLDLFTADQLHTFAAKRFADGVSLGVEQLTADLDAAQAEVERLRGLAATCYAGLGAECDLPETWLDALNAAAGGEPFTTDGLLPFAARPQPKGTEPIGTIAQFAAALDWITNGVKLNANTAHLVLRFAQALAEKLSRAEVKYGYSDGWMQHDWMDECRAQLMEHVAKGDPRDVAAYCAFLWHHGQSTAMPQGDPEGSPWPQVVSYAGGADAAGLYGWVRIATDPAGPAVEYRRVQAPAPAPQRYSPTGEGSMEIDSLGAWVKYSPGEGAAECIAGFERLFTGNAHPQPKGTEVAQPQQDGEAPRLPPHVVHAIAAYGDERADENPLAGNHLGAAIRLIREWAATISAVGEPEDAARARVIAANAQRFADDRTHLGNLVYVNDLVWALGVLAAPQPAEVADEAADAHQQQEKP